MRQVADPTQSDRDVVVAEPPHYDHNADLTPPHFFAPDPDDSTSCLTCGSADGWGCLHLTERGEFDTDEGVPRCPNCEHFRHSAACDVVVSRWPERLCPCGGERGDAVA